MTIGRPEQEGLPVGSLVGDLVRTLRSQNADQRLIDLCLDQLLHVVETLGDATATASVRERLGETAEDAGTRGQTGR